jgi:hypothetical protein
VNLSCTRRLVLTGDEDGAWMLHFVSESHQGATTLIRPERFLPGDPRQPWRIHRASAGAGGLFPPRCQSAPIAPAVGAERVSLAGDCFPLAEAVVADGSSEAAIDVGQAGRPAGPRGAGIDTPNAIVIGLPEGFRQRLLDC